MSKYGCILWQTPAGWRLASLSPGQSAWHTARGGIAVEPQALADEVSAFVSSAGLSPRIGLALTSTATVAASFTAANLADLRDRRLLAYQLEDLLPLAAEDFVADFIIDGQHVLGVAVLAAEFQPIVTALEAQGLYVQSISPAALMALQSFLAASQQEVADLASCDLIAWQNGPTVELLRVGSRLLDWYHLPAEAAALERQIGAILLQQGGQLRTLLIDLDRPLQLPFEKQEALAVQNVQSESMAEHARHGAAAALSGSWKPWIELRRGGLMSGDPYRAVRGARQLALLSVALFLVSLVSFFGLRTRQYSQAVAAAGQRQEMLFREAFPGTDVPAAVSSRLRSEQTKLRGARGEEAAVRLPPSALNVLYALVTSWPDRLRLQIGQIRIEDGQIDVDVNVESVGQAGQLADALQSNGFAIEPPATEQRAANLVAARIHGVHKRSNEK